MVAPLVEPASELTIDEVRRYSRHLIIPDVGMVGQKRLKNAKVLVIGAGGLGLMAIAMLKAQGHRNIAVAEIDPGKWEAARELGAVDIFDPSAASTRDRLLATPGGLSGAVDFVGATETARLAFDTLRKGGRFVAVGLYGGEMPLWMVRVFLRAITSQGSFVGTLM